MPNNVSFQLYFTEGPKAGQKAEVMNVDLHHWEALRKVLATQYAGQGILPFLQQELPIHIKRETLLAEEGNMRKVKDQDLDEDAYIALFSLDVFIRQLEDLVAADILFEQS
ncbi:MAG: hypothetical protein D6730_15155 [Bacteroidetes bacterium]|nr:MAG: hypothetical protein D6730_15155 [Bacteroidota bacterium]